MTKATTDRPPRWTPVTYFALMAVLGLVMTAYFVVELMRHGFSGIILFLMLLMLFGAVMNGRALERFRLTPGGLAIQHLLTRRTRIIPYAAIEEIIRAHRLRGRGHPGLESLKVRHGGRVDELKFFERAEREAFLGRLEACRQGDIEGNLGQAELPAARVVDGAQPWIYPWRRAR